MNENNNTPLEEKPVLGEDVLSGQPDLPKKTFGARLVDKETRLGRFNRSFLRWAAVIVGFFALGLLTTYLLLYNPLKAQLANAKNQAAAVQEQLTTAQTNILALETDKTTLTSQQDQANGQIAYLIFKADLLQARLSLKSSTGGPDAMNSLQSAQTTFETLSPYISKIKANMVDVLKARLDVVVAELTHDAKQAGADLDLLYEDLLKMESDFIPAK